MCQSKRFFHVIHVLTHVYFLLDVLPGSSISEVQTQLALMSSKTDNFASPPQPMRFLLSFYTHLPTGVSTHASCQWVISAICLDSLPDKFSGHPSRHILTHPFNTPCHCFRRDVHTASFLSFERLCVRCFLASDPREDCVHCLESSLRLWLPVTPCFSSKVTRLSQVHSQLFWNLPFSVSRSCLASVTLSVET